MVPVLELLMYLCACCFWRKREFVPFLKCVNFCQTTFDFHTPPALYERADSESPHRPPLQCSGYVHNLAYEYPALISF